MINPQEDRLTAPHNIIPLAKVMIATAWADGSIHYDEINTVKDLLFQLHDMTASDWAELDVYIETPVSEAERERLVAELLDSLKTQADKDQALASIDALANADGSLSAEEQAALHEIKAAVQEANPGVFGRMGKLLGNSVKRRSQAAAQAPNRELYLDDFTRNKIFYSVSRRLELDGGQIDVAEQELRRMSLAGGLMARVAYVDGEIQAGERATMVETLRRHWQIPQLQAELVAEIAVSEIARGMDYYRLSREFFKSTTEDERVRFLDVLFAVAAGDGEVSYQETEEIRTIANVQKLTHKQFIDAKLKIL
jgi:uncharacterized tellurite resistance protein B-like protein